MRKIAVLGYGKEGSAVEAYFAKRGDEVAVFDNFAPEDLGRFGLEEFDLVFRSPSVRPRDITEAISRSASGVVTGGASGAVTKDASQTLTRDAAEILTSSTRYFFHHCPCPIIGVTGTKGKGTTCSMIAAILQELGKTVHLVGNIGLPAIAKLDEVGAEDIVVYELSSFQLWDLDRSPEVAVVLRIEPDHLDIHDGFEDYLAAKSHIVIYQKPSDACVYFADNPNSVAIAEKSPARVKIPYPEEEGADLKALLDCLKIPGQHNRENAQAALLAVMASGAMSGGEDKGIMNDGVIGTMSGCGKGVVENGDAKLVSEKAAGTGRVGGKGLDEIPPVLAEAAKRAFAGFKGLPHHIEWVRKLNGVDYYDDSFSASYPAMDVAIASLADRPIVLIAGGKNRHLDLENARKRIFSAPSVMKVLLMGETAPLLAEGQNSAKYELVSSLAEAVEKAKQYGEALAKENGSAVVLLSPGAASFDMFANFAERGEEFQRLVKKLGGEKLSDLGAGEPARRGAHFVDGEGKK